MNNTENDTENSTFYIELLSTLLQQILFPYFGGIYSLTFGENLFLAELIIYMRLLTVLIITQCYYNY